jgi:ribosomal protein S18 acetylase RimI-like enzyme
MDEPHRRQTYDRAVVLDIRPLTPERLPDLAELFGQGGDPKWCWCAWYRVRSTDFSKGSTAGHRAVLEAAVDHDAQDGRAPGLIAYRDDAPVGWVSVGQRIDYERLTHSRILAPVDDQPVWSIVCFVVGRRSRGQGVARALLDTAIEYAREHDATMLEAYPVEVPDGERIDAAQVYKGTLSMFERAGFQVVERRTSPGTKRPRPIVRLAL